MLDPRIDKTAVFCLCARPHANDDPAVPSNTEFFIGIGGSFMNQPVMGGVTSVNAPSYVKHQKLINWVAEIAALTK
ncbi:hypothetical protein, partial [Klebsiella pneumoniae]|uniref:hypothetical protein n=1 Tax=Klebsiella pneumoniae TaxID=573 RepID=UPI00132F8529